MSLALRYSSVALRSAFTVRFTRSASPTSVR
ncbi:Uncharacterised protein [Mycobacteroides abscessus subsp. abscessus]|nr:Uncharacterised protein [Mycobacteroides abscessus subsp. abscessus]